MRPGVPVLVACTFTIAACGGDGKGPPLSAEAFREQANAICVAGDDEFAEAGEDLFGGEGPTVEDVADFYLDEALPIARRKLDQLEDLNPPEGSQDELDDLIARGREAIESVEEGLSEDPVAYLNQGGPDPFAGFDAKARELGLDDCATPEPPLPGEEEGTGRGDGER